MTNDDQHSGECAGQLPLPGLEHLPRAITPEPVRTRRAIGVWCTAQSPSRSQRTGRYLPETIAHPGRMLPAIARHVIETYTEPHDLVLDPMCGIGTTLIEAMHLGRNAVGVEYERQWAGLAQRGINHARAGGAQGAGFVWNADARSIPDELVEAARGRVKLLLTSPPYGPTCHGQVKVHGRAGHAGAIAKTDQRYSKDRHNLAHRPAREMLAGFTDVLAAAHPLLAPGGIVAVTARPWRRDGNLIDLPAAVLRAGRAAGYVPLERCVALLARCEQIECDEHELGGCSCVPAAPRERLVAHGSFFQLDAVRRANARGVPQSLITHEDVLCMIKEESSRSSRQLKGSQVELQDTSGAAAGSSAEVRGDEPGRDS